MMKSFYTFILLFTCVAANAQNITQVEYFFDTDPGYGNAINVPVTPAAALTDLTFNVPLGSVSDGFHTLYVRVKNASNNWSTVQNRTFIKIPTAPNITQIEYFVDTDPGIGNGTSVPFTPAPVLTDFNFSVNVSALANGNHKLFVRVKNALGRWSTALSQDFSVCNLAAPVATAATNVTTTGFVANWNAVAGATSYEVNASGDDFVNFSTGTTTDTFINAINMPANTTIKYRVRAIGANCTSAFSNIISVTTLPKQNQTITFGTISDKTLGSTAFTLNATASSGLAVSYTAGNNKISVSGSSVTLVSAGRTSITANQAGNAAFNAATPITQSFCIKPAKPTVTLSSQHSATILLTSSSASGNQWFKNGAAIAGANASTLNVSEPSIYQVQVTVDDCVSELSNEIPIVITGIEPGSLSNLSLYPNPVDDIINLAGITNLKESKLTDISGRVQSIEFKQNSELYQADVHGLASGVYLLMIRDEFTVKHIRFNKK